MEKMLFNHQIEGIRFLKTRKKAILADVMGLGKTRQAIYASQGKTAIICPASVKYGWLREIEGTVGGRHIVVHHSNGSTITDNPKGHGKWHIANYDILGKENVWNDIKDADTIILDEAHYIKNTSSKRSKICASWARGAKRVYLLTGTPIMDRPIDLFNLLRAINHPLGENWYIYAVRYCSAFRQTLRDGRSFLNVKGASRLDELKEKTKGSILRRTKDVLNDLPEKMVTNIEVEIDDIKRKEYENAFNDYIEYLLSIPQEELDKNIENIFASKHIVELQKMKKVASLAKIPKVIEDALNAIDQGEKVVIFTQYTETLETIKTELIKKKIKTASIRGSNTAQERNEAVRSFQEDPGTMAFVGNIKAAGIGITLTASSIVMFCDMDWTPSTHEQAEDRTHRIGQKNMVSVYYYVAKNTVDEDIVDLLRKKKHVISRIMEGSGGRSENINMASDLIRRIAQRAHDIS